MKIELLNNVTLFQGDCRETLRSLPDNSVDSVPCDPPYELNFMGKGWDRSGIANDPEFWREVYRVLKPGGHLAAFSASRTYHRMACAIEDAGFEIRDSLMWIYGTGFPKSLDVSKAIDKLDAADMRRERQLRFTAWMRETGLTSGRIDDLTGTNMGGHYTTAASQPAVATRDHFETLRPHFNCAVPDWVEQMVDERTVESENFKRREVIDQKEMRDTSEIRLAVTASADDYDALARRVVDITAPATAAAAAWSGFGTALKPAFEPIVLARKPLSEPTVAANVLKWRTGALNIDGCRVGTEGGTKGCDAGPSNGILGDGLNGKFGKPVPGLGRWPANVVTDGSDEVVGLFPSAGGQRGAVSGDEPSNASEGNVTGKRGRIASSKPRGDSGSAARFFYSAKASKADRAGSKHPTVKPISLMAWLARLITPPGGTVLDPFAGSGTTGAAAVAEGFSAILCERESEYVADIKRRIGEPLTINEPAKESFPWE